MSGHEWLMVGAVLAGLFLGLPVIRLLAKKLGSPPEVARKTVHVAMGLSCAAFPLVFERALPVIVLAGIATVPLVLIRFSPKLRQGIGSALHGVSRPSYGEILFAPAVAAVFAWARGDLHLYVVPILILTIADAAGALGGTRWGTRRYGSGEGFKTVEGSLVFFGTAFLCAFLPLWLGGRTDAAHAFWIGLILAILAMMAEGLSDRGFDNLVLPLGGLFVLDRLLTLEVPSLVGRSVVAVLLLILVLVGSRWSTLSGGALLGGVLLGYSCAVLADWRFALPLVAVFVCHLVTTRKHCLTHQFDHRLDVVLSLAIACLPWVIAANTQVISMSVGLAGVSFAIGAQLAILDTATRLCVPHLRTNPTLSVMKGFLLASLPGLIWLWPMAADLVVPVATTLPAMWMVVLLFQQIESHYRGHITGLWIIKGILALAASTPAWILS